MTALPSLADIARAAVLAIAADAKADRDDHLAAGGRKSPHFLQVELWPDGRAGWWWRPAGLAGSPALRRLAETHDDLVLVEVQAGPLEPHPEQPGVWRLPVVVLRLSDLEREAT